MIFNDKKLQQQINSLRSNLKYFDQLHRDQYWKLWHKHEALVKSLGLKQRDVPAKTEFVKDVTE